MQIALISTGNPRDPLNWSGTTRNLILEFEKQGHAIETVAAGPHSPIHRFFLRASAALQGTEMTFSPECRAYAGKKVARELEKGFAQVVLHTGNSAFLPPNSACESQYLYCDSTWYSRYARNPYLSPIIRWRSRAHKSMDRDERAALGRFRHIFCISEVVGRDLVDHYQIDKKKITVVGTGSGRIVPLSGEKQTSESLILFVARHAFEMKGGELLLEAFEKAVKVNTKLTLVIVAPKALEKRTKGIPRVSVTGNLSWDSVQDLFYRAQLFVMPALYEPWGLVYVEALLCKTPIMGLNRNALPQITDHGRFGVLVEEPSADALATAILAAFSDPLKLKNMGEEGQSFCLKNYSWQIVVQRMLRQFAADAVENSDPLKITNNASAAT